MSAPTSPADQCVEKGSASPPTSSSKNGGASSSSFNPRRSLKRQMSTNSFDLGAKKMEEVLTPEEKRFILLVERGDTASVAKTIAAFRTKPQLFDLNCVDPLGRSGLSIAIINENPEMMELLLSEGIHVKDALLLAISEQYVEGVELLLHHEERTHEPGQPYSWEAVDAVSANYTPDITPLILAAHHNNYEILKILLDRGASLPQPHDLKCSCEACLTASQEDSLRFSLSRINAYRALASPSLIALTSSDPILTAFQLSDELKKLKKMESQFFSEYNELRLQVQSFATALLDHARTSYELEVMLNYDHETLEVWDPGETQTLERLKLALKCKQKSFVAHPNVQQLLATIWYEGLPGWRRMNIVHQTVELLRLGLMFPIYCLAYMICPGSSRGAFMKNPFVKFIAHSASYVSFLLLLAAASQRVERMTLAFIGEQFQLDFLLAMVEEWAAKERGSFPSPIECIIIFWVFALIWKEIKQVYDEGMLEYMSDLWNLADCFTNMCFVGWIVLRMTAWFIVKREEAAGINPYYPREQWHAYDPYLISEGLFGAGMISSFLKLVHIFSINPHLGPLQISLGRMAMDIAKWLVLYVLVLFAFGCGMNQLLWYYADLEYNKCYSLPGGLPDLRNHGNACLVWRRFANLFETSQSLFWASFGLVSLADFELTGIKEFTRFWALLMFGSYSVCNIIVLLNMLIAMMSNSFQIISEKSDTEWKFARTKLWISYFETGSTVPPPFNLVPTLKHLFKLGGCAGDSKGKGVSESKAKEAADKRYSDVMKCIVRRYITAEQKKTEEFAITEDDVNEIRQDINKFRYEMIDILRSNNFSTPNVTRENVFVGGKRAKQMERRVLKGFNIAAVDSALKEAFAKERNKNTDFFKVVAKAIGHKSRAEKVAAAGGGGGSSSPTTDHIGSSKTFAERRMASYRKTVIARGGSRDDLLDGMTSDQLVEFNPKLKDYTPQTRLAYAKFKTLGHMARQREILEERTKAAGNGTDREAAAAGTEATVVKEVLRTSSGSRFASLLRSASATAVVKESIGAGVPKATAASPVKEEPEEAASNTVASPSKDADDAREAFLIPLENATSSTTASEKLVQSSVNLAEVPLKLKRTKEEAKAAKSPPGSAKSSKVTSPKVEVATPPPKRSPQMSGYAVADGSSCLEVEDGKLTPSGPPSPLPSLAAGSAATLGSSSSSLRRKKPRHSPTKRKKSKGGSVAEQTTSPSAAAPPPPPPPPPPPYSEAATGKDELLLGAGLVGVAVAEEVGRKAASAEASPKGKVAKSGWI